MKQQLKITKVGTISNNYGYLLVTEHKGKFYWIIPDWDTDINNIHEWEEISKELYDSLLSHNEWAKSKKQEVQP